ncbi:neuronal acetylcholine receptor subunit alpha-9-like isoform X2 [Amphiura filiformis]|uniref:neuronal acetylcholine receptor subunit alpha-9-like isoform X2 n=1 Tax=Amphiura filiformis TaxID=82378 RepID=UPI003B224337
MRKNIHNVLAIWLLLHFLLATDASHPRGDDYNLTTELFSKYGSTNPRPVGNSSTQVEVVISLNIARIIELNENMQTLTVWYDEFLTWNTSKYSIPYINIPPSWIWRPDLHLYDNIDRNFKDFEDVDAWIFPDGMVHWVSPNILKTICVIDPSLFPFDTQRCPLKFGSWSYNEQRMNVTVRHLFIGNYFLGTGVWELEDVVSQRAVVNYGYLGFFPEITYTLVLKRLPEYYITTLIIPCIMLSILNLLTFILPTASGEKVSLGITNLLALVLFQQVISNLLPPTSHNIPIISYYFAPMIAISCFSVISGVLVAVLFHQDKAKPIPQWLRKMFKLQTSVDQSAEDHRFNVRALDGNNDSEPTGRNSNGLESLKKGNGSVYAVSHGDETPHDEYLDDSVKRGCEKGSLHVNHNDTNEWQKIANKIDNIFLAISFVATITAVAVTIVLFLTN